MGRVKVERNNDPVLSNILDPDSLDPDMAYRFVQERGPNIARKKMVGYRAVTREDGVRTLFDMDEDDATGVIRDGDTVLMSIPKVDLERRQAGKEARRKARLAAADSKFREMARRTGVRVADTGVGKEPPDEE